MSRDDQARTVTDLRAAAFAVECPACRAHLAATPGLAGGPAACPVCQAEFLVPAAAPPQASTAPIAFAEPPLPSTRRRPDDAFVVAETDVGTAAAGASPFVFHEPVRTVTAGSAVRRPTPAEKRRRRARRNLLILVVGAALLAALVAALAAGGR